MLYTDKQIKLSYKNGTLATIKNNMIEHEIAKKYSIGTQIAILRQAETKQEDYAEFNAYAEECKTNVKEYIAAVIGTDVSSLTSELSDQN